MRTVIRAFATACALAVALLFAGCGGQDTKASREVFLQPVAVQGPDPFTRSTAVSTASPSPVTTTAPTGSSTSTEAAQAVRSFPGSTPGLYGGTQQVGSCDVDRQIDYLTSDRAKARTFAEVVGVSPASVTAYLRGLTPVLLRADTRVTDHGFRGGRATGFQSVLQAGTAVLVDNRGVPRVRCACGNPLKPAVAAQGGQHINGRPWSGYRPAQVIVVTPAPQVITNITIVDIADNTWMERHIGHDVHHDHIVPPPALTTPATTPDHSGSSTGPSRTTGPGTNSGSTSPGDKTSSPSGSSTDCATPPTRPPTPTPTPTPTVTPGATDDVTTQKPSAGPTDCPSTTAAVPGTSPGATGGIGPETVPDTPGLSDGGGQIPHDTTSRSIFDSPTGVFDG